jgi:hypothetical protein
MAGVDNLFHFESGLISKSEVHVRPRLVDFFDGPVLSQHARPLSLNLFPEFFFENLFFFLLEIFFKSLLLK